MTMKIERRPVKASKKTQLLATLFATIGSFGLGTVLSWSAPTLPQLDLDTQGCEPSEPGLGGNTSLTLGAEACLLLTREEQSWVASLLNFGAFTAGPISGQSVRKKTKIRIRTISLYVSRFADAEVR